MRRLGHATLAFCACLAACGLGVVGDESQAREEGARGQTPDASSLDSSSDGGAPASDGSLADGQDVDAGAIDPGTALRFSQSAYVRIGALAIPADFTLEAWVRPVSFGSERILASRDRKNEGGGQFRLGHDATGRLFFLMADSSGNDHGLFSSATGYALRSPAALTLGVWSHVAVSKNGAQFALYLDGAAVQSVTVTEAFSHGGSPVEFRIGARVAPNGTGADGVFDGEIDEVRLWSVPRTAAEIAAARGAPLQPDAPGFANLAAYYRFDEGNGTTAAPTAGALTGTLVGAPTWVTATWP